MAAKAMRDSDRLRTGEKRKITRLGKDLVAWFADNRRDLPWRRDSVGHYELICVEVLLQRTQAEVVASMYPEFFERFPTWRALASCQTAELEKVLHPLGLWRRRAKALKALAEYAVVRNGWFPSSIAELSQVPAVGQYVGNAILLFQHGAALPLVDVNMARILERFVRERRLSDIRYDPWLQAAAKWLVRVGEPREINWAALDFAALVCRTRNPTCQACPVRARCNSMRHHTLSRGDRLSKSDE